LREGIVEKTLFYLSLSCRNQIKGKNVDTERETPGNLEKTNTTRGERSKEGAEPALGKKELLSKRQGKLLGAHRERTRPQKRLDIEKN